MKNKVRRLMKIDEVAEMLKLSKSTLYRMAALGEIPSVKLPSGALRFDSGDIQSWIDSGKKEGAA